jgi:hypothetical protein
MEAVFGEEVKETLILESGNLGRLMGMEFIHG